MLPPLEFGALVKVEYQLDTFIVQNVVWRGVDRGWRGVDRGAATSTPLTQMQRAVAQASNCSHSNTWKQQDIRCAVYLRTTKLSDMISHPDSSMGSSSDAACVDSLLQSGKLVAAVLSWTPWHCHWRASCVGHMHQKILELPCELDKDGGRMCLFTNQHISWFWRLARILDSGEFM